ncbi:G5 domain-containing protein [Naasia sp. SYSU D00057]|uniref:G5 domain-containing protein n=1 Tax=Naasia sp. SYSU D00057 TaxID=2817380 RepID=UPI001B313565|nr:G5 domain-containing protein [Naasia sp. SYSU D00057]
MSRPAGWYKDPEKPGQMRWWDGEQWASQLFGAPTSDTYASATARSASAPPRRFGPLLRPRNVVIAASAALLLFIGAISTGGAHAQLANGAAAISDADAMSKPTAPGDGPEETFTTAAETEVVPFSRTTVDDPSRDAGTSAVTQVGVDGVRTKTYRVTLHDGIEVERTVTADEITTPPVEEITSVGTYVAPPAPVAPPASAAGEGCDPNYGGACVPIDFDVDCDGGAGNGPSYVRGPVTVVGSDIYALDRDGDGIACDVWY